jgi:hypothetical protein
MGKLGERGQQDLALPEAFDGPCQSVLIDDLVVEAEQFSSHVFLPLSMTGQIAAVRV